MYVRLAFAVAAFLEPEILIVDEVLAVGDAEFQKKCLGRMQDVSRSDGRTVLFVSHNMGAVNQLCDKSIMLENGGLKYIGKTSEIINLYIQSNTAITLSRYIGSSTSEKPIWFKEIFTCDSIGNPKNEFLHDEEIFICFRVGFSIDRRSHDFSLFLMILSASKERIAAIESDKVVSDTYFLKINPNLLVRGSYSIHTFIHKAQTEQIDVAEDVCVFDVIDNGSRLNIHGGYNYGNVFLSGEWQIR